MTTQTFDVIIIGSGQAGTPLAFRMAGEGKKVALIESRHFGGTCVNVGCTPTKAYVASARRMWDATHGAALGIVIPKGARADLKKIKARKDAIVRQSSESILRSLEKNKKIKVFKGEATFSGFKTIDVDGNRLFAGQIFINTGASALVPEPFKAVKYLTNETILELEQLPEHLVVVGGSYLGLEFAQMFRRFGSKVTIVEKAGQLVSKEDIETSKAIKQILEEEDIDVRLNASCVEVKTSENNTITVSIDCKENPSPITGTHLLLAIGRKPNTKELNPEATGLSANEKGYIEVNEQLETSVAGIYALGDCNGRGAFTHTSYNDYEIVSDNLFEGKERRVSDRIQTYCMYIDPPLARAGMTKKEALEKGYKLLEAVYPMEKVSRAQEKGETKGFMNAIIDADTQKILGATLLGSGADEVIGFILSAMHARMPYNMVRNIMLPHPTVTELIPTMLSSAKKIDSLI